MDHFYLDPDVRALADFVRENISGNRRVGVTKAMAQLAPILWSDLKQEHVTLLENSTCPGVDMED